jgi:ribosomal-protein-serine acetyltransferase
VHTFSLDEQTHLRLPEESDDEELYALIAANREYLSRWMPWAPHQTRDGTLEFIRASRKQLADNQGFQTVIVQHGRIVGVLGFHRIDWENLSTTIGYWIVEAAQGRGTITRSVAALTDHALRIWKLNRVEIRAAVDNERSRAVPRRLDFVEEGVLRQSERVGDRFVDHVVYSMLAEDWPGAPSPDGTQAAQRSL